MNHNDNCVNAEVVLQVGRIGGIQCPHCGEVGQLRIGGVVERDWQTVQLSERFLGQAAEFVTRQLIRECWVTRRRFVAKVVRVAPGRGSLNVV